MLLNVDYVCATTLAVREPDLFRRVLSPRWRLMCSLFLTEVGVLGNTPKEGDKLNMRLKTSQRPLANKYH